MKILIAEEDYMMRELNSFFMEEYGFDYDIVDNGFDALSMAEAGKGLYDLCIFDVDMNVSPLDGIEVLRRIRATDGYLPLLAVTAEDYFEDYYPANIIDDCLYKPYDLCELLEKIRNLIKKSKRLKMNLLKTNVREEGYMNPEEFKEIEDKGLARFSLCDTRNRFIVHKNVQNKMSHDIVGYKKGISEFLDRAPDDPGIIHVYALNLISNKRHILPDKLKVFVEKEDKEMDKYNEKMEYPVE